MIREEYRRAKHELKSGDRMYLQTKEGLEKFNCQIWKIEKDHITFTDGSSFHYKEVYSMTHCEGLV